jgi:RND superfamily putative drug exporter
VLTNPRADQVFVLLFAFTGSLVLPLKAVLSNLLSLGAVLGIVGTVFQNDYGASLFGESKLGGIDLIVPVIMMAIAFGLSMD